MKTKILTILAMSLLVLSCGKETGGNEEARKVTQIISPMSSALIDSTQNIILKNKLVENVFSVDEMIDEETNSIFFNHGKSVGLLPQGIRPLKEDPSYLLISETRNPSITEFNSRSFPKGVRRVVVSAMDLSIDESNRLFKTYNNQNDIEEMIIVADTITIFTTFKLPGTRLILKANQIILEEKGFLALNPLSLIENPAQFENGKSGMDAQGIVLLTEDLKVVGELSKRINLNGGNGQNAGLGQPGINGSDMPYIGDYIPGAGYRVYQNSWYNPRTKLNRHAFGVQAWPGNGTDARAGGFAGTGGRGGSIRFIHRSGTRPLVIDICDYQPGQNGADAPFVAGGRAGNPVLSHWNISGPNTVHTSTAGADGVRVTQHSPKGHGVFDSTPNLFEESMRNQNFQSALISQLNLKLKYARALYMNFYIDEAYALFKSITEFQIISNVEIQEISSKASVEMAKITSHLDYFGNEATWFPELSFEINKAFNEKEIESSFANLYYVYTLKNSQNTTEVKLKSLDGLTRSIRQDVERKQLSINDSLDKIPDIQNQITQIIQKEQLVQKELDQIEVEIQRNAVSNLTPKKHNQILQAVSAICTVFPAGQPALAAIGNALPRIMSLGEGDRNWKEVIKEGVNIYKDIKNIDWEASRANWDQTYGKLINDSWKGLTRAQIEERLKAIYDAGKPLVDVIIAQKKALSNNEAPRSAIEQEIVRIKGVHSRYNKVVQLLAELVEQKQLFSRSLNDLSTKIATSREDIVGGFIQMSSISSNYLEVSGNYDPTFSRSLSDLEERSKANLLKYRYYFLKSYGYRFLKSPKVNYNPVDVFDKLVAMIAYNKGEDLNKEQYTMLKQTFTQDLQPLMADILGEIQMGTKVYAASTVLYFSKDEIQRLASGETLLINLKTRDIYSDIEEDVRISKMSVFRFIISTPEEITNPNLDLEISHTGRFDLVKGGKSYAFEMARPSKWTYRYNMVESTGEMIEIAKSFKALIASLLASFDQPVVDNPSLEYFSLLGGQGELKVKFRDDSIKRLKGATLSNLAIKIDYSYTN